jgi:hypothetical protein
MPSPIHPFAIALSIAVAALPAYAQTAPPARKYPQRTIPTRHYDLQTDVSNELAAEAFVRMDRMYEEYNQRTAAFAKPIDRRFLFMLFATREEYLAAGAPRESAGVFMAYGGAAQLMATAYDPDTTWHIIQHEGFHQFAWAQINATMPTWINEGWAEYFGAGLFTGDGYVVGIADPLRVAALLQRAKTNTLEPFAKFRAIDPSLWTSTISHDRYEQAWSMAHFLLEGDKGKYRPAFDRYMTQISRGADGEAAWHASFGPDNGAFEHAWLAYYQSLDAAAHNAPLLEQAATATVTSFLARAKASGIPVASVEDLLQKQKAGQLTFKPDPEHWLPAKLLTDRLAAVETPKWTLTWTGPRPEVTARFPDGAVVTSKFTQQNNLWRTTTTLTSPPKNTATSAPTPIPTTPRPTNPARKSP